MPPMPTMWDHPVSVREGVDVMAGTNPTGKAVLRASLELFRQDRQMLWLPVLSTVTAVIAFAVITGPIVAFAGHTGVAVVIGLALGSVVATAATVIFNVALCFAATDRIEGRRPTVQGSAGPGVAAQGCDHRVGDPVGGGGHRHPGARTAPRTGREDHRRRRGSGLDRRHVHGDPRVGVRGRRSHGGAQAVLGHLPPAVRDRGRVGPCASASCSSDCRWPRSR